MKQADKQRLLEGRKEWLHNALQSKQEGRWIEAEELYNEYMIDLQKKGGRVLVDEVSRDRFRSWVGGVDFVASKLFSKKSANNIRKYRLKEKKSCLSSLYQKAISLRFVVNGIGR